MTDLLGPPATEQLVACIDRELSFRARVYPRWVAAKKLSQAAADEQVALMQAVRARLLESDSWRRKLAELGVTI
jgi:hypothetical protein